MSYNNVGKTGNTSYITIKHQVNIEDHVIFVFEHNDITLEILTWTA